MSNFQRIPDANDENEKYLWELAEKRASFKRHLISYLLVNSMLWILWLLNGADRYGGGVPWPVWPLFGWGIGIVSHYVRAYVSTDRDSVQREYEKLKNKQ
jgi:hypothetical protein